MKRKNEAAWSEKLNRWSIKVQQDGIRKSFYSSKPGKKGKIEAERKADEWLEGDDHKEIRFGTAYAAFLAQKTRECGAAWVDQLERIGRNYLKPTLEHKLVNKISLIDWKNCILTQYEAGKSYKTLVGIRGAITCFAAYCEEANIAISPIKKLVIPRDAPRGMRRILTPGDIETLFTKDTVKVQGKEAFCWYIYGWRLLVVLGLRRGEMCGLQKGDIKDNVLTIRRSVNNLMEVTDGKTTAARRQIYLPQHAVTLLDAQAELLKSVGIISPWIFPAEDGSMSNPNYVYKRWSTYAKQHDIHTSLHEMRHTTISLMADNVPLEALKRVVGHTSAMDTLGVYGHRVEGEGERTAALFDAVLNGVLPYKK